MSEKLINVAEQMLLDMIQSVNTAKEFVIEQTPEVITQLLYWKFTISAIGFVIPLLIAGIWWYWFNRFQKVKKEMGYRDEEFCEITLLLTGLVVTLLLVIFTACNWEWLQILIAPKFFLLEYAASLVK